MISLCSLPKESYRMFRTNTLINYIAKDEYSKQPLPGHPIIKKVTKNEYSKYKCSDRQAQKIAFLLALQRELVKKGRQPIIYLANFKMQQVTVIEDDHTSPAGTVCLFIVAFFIPPLAVLIVDGCSA